MVGTADARVECSASMKSTSAAGGHVPAGHVHGGPGHERRERDTPGVDVEHRHDCELPVRLARSGAGALQRGHGVQVGRTVRVHDTARVAGRPAGVAHRRGRALVQLGPHERGLLRREQFGVGVHRAVAEHRRVALADHDVGLDRREVVDDRRERGQQAAVHDDDLVLGVVDDVHQLLGGQPDVQRVHDRAHAGDRVVGLEVLLVVPAEGSHRIAVPDAQFGQRAGQPARVLLDLAVAGVPGPIPLPRDTLAAAEHPGAMLQDRGDREREVILHRAGNTGARHA